MSRMYKVSVAPVAFTVAADLLQILAPTDAVVIVHSWEIWQTTELGDAAEEVLTLEEVRGVGAVTSGSGGSTPTAQPVEDGETAFGGTTEASNTTRMAAGAGTLETIDRHGWNVRIPYQKIYTPEERPVISPGNRWTLSIPAPADSTSIGVKAVIQELGG